MKRILLTLLFLADAGAIFGAPPADWAVQDAPYRAAIRLDGQPINPDTGTLLVLPNFGQTSPEGRDLVLMGADGKAVPIKVVLAEPGLDTQVLAQNLLAGQDYALYFGGGKARTSLTWQPKVSLFMEVRKVAPDAACESWPAMEKLWNGAREVQGGKFVDYIFQAGNPFGSNDGFVSHYTGYLTPPPGKSVYLYTVSADASFVLVNGNYEFGWPGRHLPVATIKDIKGKEIPTTGAPLRIDYYQVKASDPTSPAMALGWKKDGQYHTVPDSAWAHPWQTSIRGMESSSGDPIPQGDVIVSSCIGFADYWYVVGSYRLAYPLPEGWAAEWEFEDGTKATGTEGKHLFVGLTPQTVKLTLRSGTRTITGTRLVLFPDTLAADSVNDAKLLKPYLDAIKMENAAGMKPEAVAARLAILLEFGKDTSTQALAEAYLAGDTKKDPHLTGLITLAWLRALAQSDPPRALAELQRVDQPLRAAFVEPFGKLEADLLIFNLREPSAPARAISIASQKPGTDFERLMKIRAGDAMRILGQTSQAVAQYQAATGKLDPKRLAPADHAYSMKIGQYLDGGHRDEAMEKLEEWELRHPMTKFESDFLLLHARALHEFGRDREALTEIDSFEKVLPDDPLEIDAEYFRAQCLATMGKKNEAKKIWADLAQKYPKHPLAAESRKLSEAP